MNMEEKPMSVIILLDGDAPNQNAFIRGWFRRSRFSAVETNCVIQALSASFDFTKLSRPNVVLLEAESIVEDFHLLATLSEILSGGDHVPVLAFAAQWHPDFGEDFETDLTKLETRLMRMFPIRSSEFHHVAA
jgi:hypothetical protein